MSTFTINVNASQYSTDTTIDFMGGTFESVLTVQKLVRYFAYNSYTMPYSPALGNLQVSVVNFWSKVDSALDGSKFPAFIRVSGYLTSAELQNVQRIAIFFDNV